MLIHVPDNANSAAAARAAIMTDERLSYGAIGLLLVILNHAPRWDVSTGTLMERVRARSSNDDAGSSAFLAAVDELHDYGYLAHTRRRSGSRRAEHVEAFAVPQDAPQQEGDLRAGQVVYVIGQPGRRVAKIGTTSNAGARLRAIQTGCPVRLQVLWTCPGGRRLESWLHEAFSSWRLEGEWFDFGHSDPVHTVATGVASARMMGVR